jgi:hypothetical protein
MGFWGLERWLFWTNCFLFDGFFYINFLKDLIFGQVVFPIPFIFEIECRHGE